MIQIPTPAELAQHVTEEQETLLDQLVRRTVQALDAEWVPGHYLWIAVPAGYTGRVEQAFVARMDAAGWSVERISDQREGDALKIGAK